MESKCRYGAPKIHNILTKQGNKISLKRVQRFMKSQDIRSITVKKFRYHSDKLECHNLKNILNRDFSTTSINQKRCTDITYIHTLKDGWTYLASVMDFHSRKIIGYSYGSTMNTDLAVEAVKNACLNVKNTTDIINGTFFYRKISKSDYVDFRNNTYGNRIRNVCFI